MRSLATLLLSRSLGAMRNSADNASVPSGSLRSLRRQTMFSDMLLSARL